MGPKTVGLGATMRLEHSGRLLELEPERLGLFGAAAYRSVCEGTSMGVGSDNAGANGASPGKVALQRWKYSWEAWHEKRASPQAAMSRRRQEARQGHWGTVMQEWREPCHAPQAHSKDESGAEREEMGGRLWWWCKGE